ncbi:DNA polymerase IV [Geoalkalibacter sp.]|uniref:DNA polymerase IV n=1 Tax=Geoalkalibacter sp. TaxID=3041440 RepID=UPI00272EDDAF|nr:DNA polymerase IV [Geoalkalibacter sp.]
MTPEDPAILHLDLDAFYASVEQREEPALRGRPVIVGGHEKRGVVCAASYEARRFGVRSAMPMTRALSLCPQAVVRPVRMALYQDVSRQVFAIYARFTDTIEALSIDEAFLDVAASRRLFGAGLVIAEQIRAAVRRETCLSVSAGVAPNKLLAKLASEAAKPDGLLEIRAERIDEFLLPLPVTALWGIGSVTAEKLARCGVTRVADLRRLSRPALLARFGVQGSQLYDLARGLDQRPVVARDALKSVGHEDTYGEDLMDLEDILRQLLDLSERVAARLRRSDLQGRCLTLKVKYADFQQCTRSRTLNQGLSNGGELFALAKELLTLTEAGRRPLRLLGLSLSALEPLGAGQSELFDEPRRERLARLDRAVDQVRERYGRRGICKAPLLEAADPSAGDEKGPHGKEGA